MKPDELPGEPGIDRMRSGGVAWAIKPGNQLSQSLQDHWNAAMRAYSGTSQGYIVYLGEAMRREATR